MVETYEDAQSERTERLDQTRGGEDKEYGLEDDTEVDGEVLSETFDKVETILETGDRRGEQPGIDIPEGRSQNITVNLENATGVDLGSLASAIEGIANEDLSGATRTQILANMAKSLQAITKTSILSVRTQIEQQAALLTILENVSPASTITVSGIVNIEEPETPQPVVPDSDDKEIPTRQLIVKAHPNNSDPIYFGDSEVEPEAGFILERGEVQTIDLSLKKNALYMAAEDTGNSVSVIGWF